MSDIQRQVQNSIDRIDAQYDGKVADKEAARIIIDAIKNNDPSLLSGYRGDMFHKADAKAIALLRHMYAEINNTLGDRIRNERNVIVGETKRKTLSLSTLIKGRKSVSDEAAGKEAISSINEGNEFRYINDQITRAVIKDFEGPFIEGGLIGGALSIIRPNTNLKKAMENIASKFGQDKADDVKKNVLPKLSKQLELAHLMIKQDQSHAERFGVLAASMFEARTQNYMINQWATNSDFRKYAANKVKRGLVDIGLSSLIGIATGAFFGGMVKIPGAVIQRKDTFDQDTLAKALSDGKKTASDYLQTPLNNAASFVNREGKKEKIDTKTSKQISVQLANGMVINVGGLIDKLNQSENRIRNFLDKITFGLTDDEKGLEKKLLAYGELMQQNRVLTQAEISKAYALHGDISEMIEKWTQRESKRTGKSSFNAAVSLQALSDTKETTRLTAATESLSRGARLETFLNANRDRIEKMIPNKPKYKNTHDAIIACVNGKSYDGKSGTELANYIWTDPDIRGVQAMFNAHTYGGRGAVAAYERLYRTLAPQRKITTNGDKYGEHLPDEVLRNASAVSDYLASTENKGMNLAARYANTLGNIGSNSGIDIDVLSTDIIQYAKKGVYSPAFTGQNTGMNTTTLKEGKLETHPALVFKVPARIGGWVGTLEVGVKGDCSNLMIGEFTQERNTNNPQALIELRAPLVYVVQKGGGGGDSGGGESGGTTPSTNTGNGGPGTGIETGGGHTGGAGWGSGGGSISNTSGGFGSGNLGGFSGNIRR